MILVHEKLKHYKGKRDTFVNRIKENFDTFYDDKHDDLNGIIKYINFTDDLIKELIEANSINESIESSLSLGSQSLERIVRHYRIDAEFDKERANKWLINALVLVLRDSNTFDGVWFIKGQKKVLKSKIIKQ